MSYNEKLSNEDRFPITPLKFSSQSWPSFQTFTSGAEQKKTRELKLWIEPRPHSWKAHALNTAPQTANFDVMRFKRFNKYNYMWNKNRAYTEFMMDHHITTAKQVKATYHRLTSSDLAQPATTRE